jgi:hypothetical protein
MQLGKIEHKYFHFHKLQVTGFEVVLILSFCKVNQHATYLASLVQRPLESIYNRIKFRLEN